MQFSSRREFLGASVAALAGGRLLQAEQSNSATEHGPIDTLFLTWHRDPTTTMTIQWIGPDRAAADALIRCTTPDGKEATEQQPSVKAYPQSDDKVFRAELTGLKPGADYEFRVGASSHVYRFRTMPAKATDTISFISGGDVGTDQHAINNNIQAARQDPMFAIVGGDLGYDNGRSMETSVKFIRNYSRHMVAGNGRLIPLVVCMGNHEIDGGYNKPRDKAPFFFALFDGMYRDTSFATLDFGDYLSLVLLDTGHNSPIGGDQADWLEKTLRARADHPNVIAVNHVPCYPSVRQFAGIAGTGAENRKYWVPLFEKYRVPVVLEHHDHAFKRSKPLLGGHENKNGVLYLGDGSWGKLSVLGMPGKLSYLARSGSEYHMSLHRIQGEERFHLALNEFGKVMDVCRTGQRTTGAVAVK
jgi:acid phosphatase type 7